MGVHISQPAECNGNWKAGMLKPLPDLTAVEWVGGLKDQHDMNNRDEKTEKDETLMMLMIDDDAHDHDHHGHYLKKLPEVEGKEG